MNTKQPMLALFAMLLTGAADDSARLPSASVNSVFHIEKSENRNQVHYAVAVERSPAPRQNDRARLLARVERGPRVVDSYATITSEPMG